tara:strand:- start:5555 stop:7546 length:1992 start_codon:yes stop_codon:yes gene_type:complete
MNSLSTIANRTYLFLCYAIIFGTTLFFSTATRSVFEVNKLGIVKIALSLMGILFFYDQLFGKNTWFFKPKKNKWFNISLLIVWISNLLSTVFSKNIMVSIYGSYDRWEGIITTTFYLFMVYLVANKKGLANATKIIWAIIIAGALSSLYGIVQSYGLDIISWSLDPSMRVFGSINNPVHYCAIMGMCIPLIIGQLFYTVNKTDGQPTNFSHFLTIIFYYIVIGLMTQLIKIKHNSIEWIALFILVLGAPYIYYATLCIKKPSHQNILNILFNSLILVIYAAYLSYSRATWLGVTAATGLMFSITLITKLNLSKRHFLLTTFGCLTFTMVSYLIFLFNLYTISNGMLIGSILALVFMGCLILYPFKSNELLLNIITIGLLLSSQFYTTTYASSIILLGLMALCIYKKKNDIFNLPTRLISIMIIFMNIQFITSSFIHFLNFVILLLTIIVCEKTSTVKTPFSASKVFQWKLITILLFAFIIISPNIYLWSTKNSSDISNSKILVQQASDKINSFQSIAIEGSARSSMWKSSFPWINDHLFFGSGLDTIKYYYPKYRRPEYGKLEGGHNYTPDRLHNEYLNTLATKGIIGFITYYILFIGGAFTSLLLFIKNKSNQHQFLIVGLIGGGLVYLGQVLFNFGVVATLVYFFIFLSLGIALKANNEAS